jgi:aminoglycoside phosphotransferase (APT) family kinase protein
MSKKPWASEHSIDATGVADVVGTQFPDLRPVRAAYLDEGWDSVVYVVNDDWIFRFPKRAEVAVTQDVEGLLLPRLAPRLPLPIPVPSRFGVPTAALPLRFHGYRKLAGVPAIELPLDGVDAPACAQQMARFLTALHAFPPDEARALGVPERREIGSFERWRDHALSHLPVMAPAMPRPLLDRAQAFLARTLPKPYAGAPRLIHYDIGDAHALVDVGSRRVSGLIDWGDVCLGDPAFDVSGVMQWLGESAVMQGFPAYGDAPLDEGFLDRARVGAAYASFSALWYGVDEGRPDYVRSGLRSLEHVLPGSQPARLG